MLTSSQAEAGARLDRTETECFNQLSALQPFLMFDLTCWIWLENTNLQGFQTNIFRSFTRAENFEQISLDKWRNSKGALHLEKLRNLMDLSIKGGGVFVESINLWRSISGLHKSPLSNIGGGGGPSTKIH